MVNSRVNLPEMHFIKNFFWSAVPVEFFAFFVNFMVINPCGKSVQLVGRFIFAIIGLAKQNKKCEANSF
jgi:hypothetical protein